MPALLLQRLLVVDLLALEERLGCEQQEDDREDGAQDDRWQHYVDEDADEAADEDEGHHHDDDAVVDHGGVFVRVALVVRVDEACDAAREDGEARDRDGFLCREREHGHNDWDDQAATSDAPDVGEREQDRHHEDAHELAEVDREYALVLASMRVCVAQQVREVRAVLVDTALFLFVLLFLHGKQLSLAGFAELRLDLQLSTATLVVKLKQVGRTLRDTDRIRLLQALAL